MEGARIAVKMEAERIVVKIKGKRIEVKMEGARIAVKDYMKKVKMWGKRIAANKNNHFILADALYMYRWVGSRVQ